MPNSHSKAQVTVIAIALLCGCSPADAPVSMDPISHLNTVTPDPSVISRSTAENVVLLNTFGGHSKRVLDVAFSARGEILASSSQDMNIRLWDVRSAQEVHIFQMNSVDMADIDISTDGNMLASGEAIWDLGSMQEIHVLERGSPLPAFAAFSPDGSVLALGLFGQQIALWDVRNGRPVYTFDKQEENRTKRIEFSPDGALLAAGVNDGTVRLLDIASGKVVNVFRYSGETDIHDLAFSPDGSYLATGGRLPAVILWDVASGEVVRTFRLSDNLMSMDFSPDGTILASAGGYEHKVLLWDVESGNLLHSLPHNDQIMSIAFSPDGRLLAAGCFDNQVYLWGIPTNP
jgi:WD40 repeat protein